MKTVDNTLNWNPNSTVQAVSAVILCATILSVGLLASLVGFNENNFVITTVLMVAVVLNVLVMRRKVWLSPEIILFVLWIGNQLASRSGAAWPWSFCGRITPTSLIGVAS